ncbi:QacE family quaternary ammonium compound efflux SMR transporter, partial [Vibrio sp. D173a]|uniref:DMT family transporter n=1 Tax=Vibrio sp. D173a TaxID=2836349 RepID=UPI00255354E4
LYATFAVGVCYMVALYFLSLTSKTLPIPITYAIWAGGGIVLLTTVSMASGFTPSLFTTLGIAMIVAGIVVINLLGGIH